MSTDHPELDEMQQCYKAAVEHWVAAIRKEEALASANHSVSQVDRWAQAHDGEEAARDIVKSAKKTYEGALRSKFFGF